jgi:hypothetical protein
LHARQSGDVENALNAGAGLHDIFGVSDVSEHKLGSWI